MTPPEIRIVLNHAAAALQVELYAEAEALLTPLLALDCPEAEFLMGQVIEAGDGRGRQEERWRWSISAARKGHPQAAFEISCAQLTEDFGVTIVERDRMLAFAAKARLVDAFHSLGVKYATGSWGKSGLSNRGLNPRKSFQWYHRAARAGDWTSAFEVGYMYLYGEGVEKNVVTGLDWLQRAALNGETEAAYCLQYLYGGGDENIIAANAELQQLWRKVYLLHEKHPRPF